jgi:ATP-dependent DNA helicase RecG
MDELELLEVIERGEDSRHQFKQNINNPTSMAAELAAFANSKGGELVIGINDDGTIYGLTKNDIKRLNNMISNVASSHIRNPINPITENIQLEDGLTMVITVQEGIDKPYFDNDGIIWVRSGADKRKVTSREEMRRLFAEADLIHADEITVNGSTINDLDEDYFDRFYEEINNRSREDENIPLLQLLQNMNLANEEQLNLAGILLFGKNTQKFKPQFVIKAVYFKGNEPTVNEYIDSEDIEGKLTNQYALVLAFLRRNLPKSQQGQGRNTLGKMDIPEPVFEELIVNALIHRDYFVDSPVRIFIFKDRIEIISPGILPNNLTEENIKSGVSVQRNPILASFSTKTSPPLGLPYRGIGTGIRKAYNEYKKIELKNDIDNNQFVVAIYR